MSSGISTRILHIANDEKFIAAADHIFEIAYPGCNTFFIIDERHSKLEFVDPSKINYELYGGSTADLMEMSAKLGQYDLVVLHWLDEFKCKLVLKNSNRADFLWMLWGGEIYDDEEIYPFKTIGPATWRLLGRDSLYHTMRQLYKRTLRTLHLRRLKHSIKLAALDKLPMVGMADSAEVNYFRSLNILSADIKPIRFFYYRSRELGPETAPDSKRKNILIGNSAAYTNNHLEIFQILATLNLENQRLIVPLGYSNNEEYVERLSRSADLLFGEKFRPINDFMDIDTYHDLMRGCGYAIFNHYRRQALGTILMCFQMGLRVFLSPEGRNHQFFKRMGFQFNSVGDLSTVSGILLTPLSRTEASSNQALVRKMCSLEKIVEELKEDLEKYLFTKAKKKFYDNV